MDKTSYQIALRSSLKPFLDNKKNTIKYKYVKACSQIRLGNCMYGTSQVHSTP